MRYFSVCLMLILSGCASVQAPGPMVVVENGGLNLTNIHEACYVEVVNASTATLYTCN